MKTLECRGITLSDKQTKICVPITGTDLEEIKEQAEKIANMNPDRFLWCKEQWRNWVWTVS